METTNVDDEEEYRAGHSNNESVQHDARNLQSQESEAANASCEDDKEEEIVFTKNYNDNNGNIVKFALQDTPRFQPQDTTPMEDSEGEEEIVFATNHDSEGNDEEGSNILVASYRRHLTSVSKITGGIIATEIFQNTLPVVDIAFIGRLPDSKDELAAAALATVWFNLWDATMLGFMTAVDTLLAQSYGANDKIAFRAWAGTSLVIVTLVAVLVGGLLALCGPVMKIVGQDPDLADAAAAFSYRLIPGLFPQYIFAVLVKYLQAQDILMPGIVVGLFANGFNMVKYLQAQDILMPGIVVGLFANGFNIFFNWLLIYALDMRIVGAAWATTLTQFAQCFLLILYVLYQKPRRLKDMWPVYSNAYMTRESLRSFWELSISGALSESAESWFFELTAILAGLLGATELNAHIITMTISYFVFLSFTYAAGIAATIRVGQLIGDGKATDACQSAIVSVILAVAIQAVLVAILLPSSEWLGETFSSDKEVADLVAVLIPLSCIFMMGDAVQGTNSGILRGLGRQKLVLCLSIFTFWGLAVPVGSVLTFVVDLDANQVTGLWWGMVVGIYASFILGSFILKFRVDWKLETRKASERVASMSKIHIDNTPPEATDNALCTDAASEESTSV